MSLLDFYITVIIALGPVVAIGALLVIDSRDRDHD